MATYESEDKESSKQFIERFYVTCNHCGSLNINVSFYPGYTSCGVGNTGHLVVECLSCKLKFEDY